MLNTCVRLFALCLGFALWVTPSAASTRVGIYAIIDEVTFEPSDREPDRVWISGTFVVPTPISSGDHGAPTHGHLYFSVNPDARDATRNEWAALLKAAGTGEVVGFGEYWMSCSRIHVTDPRLRSLPSDAHCSLEVAVKADRTSAVAEPYPAPSSEGVVTAFDHEDDICPRFGRPSVQIVAEIRATRAIGVPDNDVAACSQSVGLVPSSSLERTFPTQTRNREWAGGAEALILRRLNEAPALRLSELGVECRDTICHVRLVFPSREYRVATGNKLAARALEYLPAFAGGAQILEPGDAATTEYYVQRKNVPATETAQSSSR
jgi:hypothetical protein